MGGHGWGPAVSQKRKTTSRPIYHEIEEAGGHVVRAKAAMIEYEKKNTVQSTNITLE